MRKLITLIAVLALCIASTAFAQTLAEVQERGVLRCGIASTNVVGFEYVNEDGTYGGLDVDFCRTVAAAVLGDSEAVEYRLLSAQERFPALQTGEVDMLSRVTTWTSSRDTALGLNFAPTTFYDGQGFMVRGNSGIETVEDMDGTTICVQSGTTTELNLADVMAANDIDYTPLLLANSDQVRENYESGACDVWTTDSSALVAQRTTLANPSEHNVLGDKISKEPLGPVVAHGDDQWFDVVKWTIFATFLGEELGVTSENALEMLASSNDPNVQRLLGANPENVEQLGLSGDAFLNVLEQVGNYAEIYDRNLGPDTVSYIPRGLNSSYLDGGLIYAPPIR